MARDLSEAEIKPVLTLKHEEIGRFCFQHRVRGEWLLEGEGQIFEPAPPLTSKPSAEPLLLADQKMDPSHRQRNPGWALKLIVQEAQPAAACGSRNAAGTVAKY